MKAGEQIIKQGDKGEKFYILLQGGASIIVDGTDVGKYDAGSAFGELALIYGAPRAATILATADCTLWAVGLATFRKIAVEGHQAQLSTNVAFLKQVKILDGLNPEQVEAIGRALVPVGPFPDGTYILREGDAGEDFFLVESGAVKCTHNKLDGSEKELITLGRGDHFGEMALMLDEPRHANVVAVGETLCLKLGRSDFEKLFGPLQEALAQQMRIRILRSVPLLKHLHDGVLDRLSSAMRVQFFEPGQSVLQQGDTRNQRFYIINDGDAKITKNVVDDAGAKTGEKEVGKLEAGDYFGERALIHNEPRGANVVASSELECLVLGRAEFETLLVDVAALFSLTLSLIHI